MLDDRLKLVLGILNVRRPVEAAYFNGPMAAGTKPTNPEAQGGYAMSQPAWDVERRQVVHRRELGFYVVGLTNGVKGTCSGSAAERGT